MPGLTREALEEVLAGVGMPRLRQGPVAYSMVKPLKLKLLDVAFENFSRTELSRNTRQARAFRAWVAGEAAWIEGYGLFRALMDENSAGERWDLWPVQQRTLATARGWLAGQPAAPRKRIERRVRFFKWVQWVAFKQWEEAKTYAEERGVSLMGDVPFGVSYCLVPCLRRAGHLRLAWSGAAP